MGVFVFRRRRVSMQAKPRGAAFWLALTAVYALCAWYAVTQSEMRLDEPDHFAQIQRFLAGDFRFQNDILTTVPGYHLVMAGLLRLFHADSFAAARLVSSSFGLLAVLGFHRLRRDVVGRDDFLATAQFAMLPILLLFVFMVQTDVLSLALMLWTFWARGRRQHWLGGLLLLAATCVRQNNVIWALLLVWPGLRAAWQQRSFMLLLRSGLPYGVVVLAFLAYWRLHGSVAFAHEAAGIHPDVSLHSGNLFCMLFLGALLFFAPCASTWRQFTRDLRRQPWLIALPLGLLALYLATFTVDNPYNLLVPPDLRDWLLMRTQASVLWYCAFGAIAVIGGVGMLRCKLLEPDRTMFWIVAALFVSLIWLIEQRYYLIPFALFMAWRAPAGEWAERTVVALWAPLAVLLFWGMMTGNLYI